jgi:hypothetical protein
MVSTMWHPKQGSKGTGRVKTVTVIGVAGALSLAGGAAGQPSVRQAIHRHRQLPSLRKKSQTSAWLLSMSSTTKTLKHIVAGSKLPVDVATEAAEAAQSTEVARAAQ